MGNNLFTSHCPEDQILEYFRTNKPFEINTEKLNLKGRNISVDNVQLLSSALVTNTTLTKLNLAETNIGDVGTKALSEALKNNYTLKILYLYCNNIKCEGADALASVLVNNTAITDLNLGGNNIGVKGASALSSSLIINTTLTDLELFGNDMDNKCAIELSPFLKTNSTLTFLNLCDNNISADGVQALSQAIAKNNTLLYLDLGFNNIGDDGTSQISQALKENSSITTLDLHKNKIGDVGTKELSIALKTNTTLTQLLLDSNNIGDCGAIDLSVALNTLVKLNLGNNNIGVKGANALSSSLSRNSTLTDLNLHRNKLGPEGARELSPFLERNTTLAILNISGNEIGFEGASAIEIALNTNTTLQRIIVGHEAGEENLNQLMRLRNSGNSNANTPANTPSKPRLSLLNGLLRRSNTKEEDKDDRNREEENIIMKKRKDVHDWFQKIHLTPEDKVECAKLFIEQGFDNLEIISEMSKGDLIFVKEKFKSQPGNYKKITLAIQELKQNRFLDPPSPHPSHVHPWHIEPSIKNLGTGWIKKNNTLSLFPLPLDSPDHSLKSSCTQFKFVFKALNGNLKQIKTVHIIHSFNLENLFQNSLDVHLRSLQDSPGTFKDAMWRRGTEADTPWREAIYKKFCEYAQKFPNNTDREEGLVVIPVITGYKDKEMAMKVCNNGPKSLGATDDGYFGRGIYFTTKFNYAKKYGNFLVISWVFIGNLYPVVEFPHPPVGSPEFYEKLPKYQKPTLCGKVQKTDKIMKRTVTYDTHYTIVRPFTDEGDSPNTIKYVPCEVEKMCNPNVFDEVVVFQESHILPMYLIQL